MAWQGSAAKMKMDENSSDPTKTGPTISISSIQEHGLLPQENPSSTLGLPAEKKLYSNVHLTAVVVSLICFALGIITITPSLSIAWHLQFSGQIIVIGFLLGIMSICLQTVQSFTFLLLEARFGRSRLQNYEAILSGKFTASHVSVLWRITLLSLLVLPLVLSVAYKRLLGGTASARFRPDSPGLYGIDFPRIGSWSPANNALYLLMTSFAPFWAATGSGNATYPSAEEFPIAYGYNTLLLSNDSAAILDMPTSSYLANLQDQISTDEKLTITATVDAYRTNYNDSTASLLTNDSLWSDIVSSGMKNDIGGLNTMYMYRGFKARVGFMPFDQNSQTLIALYENSTHEFDMAQYSNQSHPEFERVRKKAQIYSLQRARCHGQWTINTTSILLVDGSCDDTPVNSSVLQEGHMTPWQYDNLPALGHMYPDLLNNNHTDNVWLRATYAVSVVTMYWARGFQILYGNGPNMTYAPMNEQMVSIRQTLRAEWLLYFVLLVQPVLTALGFVVAICLHKTPIGRNFGLASILSGVEPEDLGLIRGAGLSGSLKQPVRLTVATQPMQSDSQSSVPDGSFARIRYNLNYDKEKREISSLKRHWTYW